LSDTKVTDAGLAHLKAMKKLEYLRLSSNVFTDRGLVYLKELTSLRALTVFTKADNDDAIAKVALAMPGLSLSHGRRGIGRYSHRDILTRRQF
jgi:hypothetical protein